MWCQRITTTFYVQNAAIIEEETKAEKASKVGFSLDDVDRAVADSSDAFFIDLHHRGSEPGPFNCWKYQQALEVEKIIEEETKSEKASKVGFSLDDVNRAVADSSDAFFIDLRDDVGKALSLYRDISRILDEKCGVNESPPTSNIINTLKECLGTINHIARYKFPLEESAEESDGDAVGAASSGGGVVSGPVTSREQAFKTLTEISAFFRKTEPHSPISYILARAVKWGDMPLDGLIRELIPESSARDFYSSLTGVNIDDDD